MDQRLLVVEDSPTQADFLRSALQHAGFEPTVCRSGDAALALLEGETFDIVLSDVVMPGIDGFELCRRIKSEPAYARTAVVLLTSLRDPLDVVRAIEAGADHFAHKPYDVDQLLGRIRMILDHRALRADPGAQQGVELFFLDRHFVITAERQQLLDLLVTTFEDLVETNRRLRGNETRLADAQEHLAGQLRAADLEQRYVTTLLDSLPDAVFITDASGRITGLNRTAAHMTGGHARELTGRRLAEELLLYDESGRPLDGAANPFRDLAAASAEIDDVRADIHGGRRVPVSVRVAAVADDHGATMGMVAVVRDVSASVFSDPVTGLHSRALFLDRLDRALGQAGRTGERVAVVVMTLERLDLIADTYGDAARDQVLFAAADRLRAHADQGDTLARVGQSELAVLRQAMQTPRDLLRLAEEFAAALSEPIQADEGKIVLRAAAGVSVATPESIPVTLLQEAGSAAHRARANGARSRIYDAALQTQARERLETEADLQRALSESEFTVHYQPELSLADGRIVGAEALVRWDRPGAGLFPPSLFIPQAEESGLIVPIGRWVLREACRHAAEINDTREAGARIFMAVNLSARQLEDPSLVSSVERALADTGLPPALLMLEITETAVMQDPPAAAEKLIALKQLGVALALDDFLTGHSSLTYLRDFPLDVVKIDRSFVAALGQHNEAADAIVRAVISLAKSFDLRVVAEGVETQEQRDQLADMGCDLVTGFLYAPGLTAEDFEAFLTA